MSPKAATGKAHRRKAKTMRRKWITALRIFRYGLSNFARNTWLTTAATVVMTITLTMLLFTFTARLAFNDTIDEIREKIDVSIYLVDDITDLDKQSLEDALRAVPIVTNVEYVSKEQAREKFIEDSKGNLQQLEALGALDGANPLPASFKVFVNDTNRLDEITQVVNDEQFKELQSKPASIVGARKDALENIANAAQFASIAGLGASVLFLIISIMIIFNTIRMAIFNRRDEIEIMKLIGAEKSFIRGPFIVEASLYGVIAALISLVLVYAALVTSGPAIGSYGVQIGPTQAFFAEWPLVIGLAQIGIGILIGVVSSFLAMRRYLRV
jgi:cell division transport system permease protein